MGPSAVRKVPQNPTDVLLHPGGLIQVDDVMGSLSLAVIWLWFISAAMVSPSRSGLQLEPTSGAFAVQSTIANRDRLLLSGCIAGFHPFFGLLRSYGRGRWCGASSNGLA